MSNLTSIASILASPSKLTKPPTAAIEAAKMLPSSTGMNLVQRHAKETERPISPSSPSRVPVPVSPLSGSSKNFLSPQQHSPRPRSPVTTSAKSFSPPLRTSSRIAAQTSPKQGSSIHNDTVTAPMLSPGMKSPKAGRTEMMPKLYEEKFTQNIQGHVTVLPSSITETASVAVSPVRSEVLPIMAPKQFADQRQPEQAPYISPPLRSPRLQQQQLLSQQHTKIPVTAKTNPLIPLSPPAKSPLRAAAQKAIVSPLPNQPQPTIMVKTVVKSVREEIEASLAAAKYTKMADQPTGKGEEAIKVKDYASEPVSGIEAGKETENPANLPTQTLDPPHIKNITTAVPLSSADHAIIRKPAPGSLPTSHNLHPSNTPLSQSTSNNIPPSPIFSSFLSSNPNRSSALSFVGLPGRILGNGPSHAHVREKSLGLGLGKSVGGSHGDDQEKDAHIAYSATTTSSAALLTSKKRLSSALDGPDLQGSSASNAKAPRLENTNATTRRVSTAQVATSRSAPLSKEEETKQRLDLLRSRISSIKGSTRPSSAATAVQSGTSSHPVRQSILSSRPSSATDQASLFSPPLSTANYVAPPFTAVPPPSSTGGSTSLFASSATSAFANAVASFVPAPSFGASFASLFGSSLASATATATVPVQARETPKSSVEEPPRVTSTINAEPVVQSKEAACASLYPSLPSVTNLAVLTSPITALPPSVSFEEGIENRVEVLASGPLSETKQPSKGSNERLSSASVQDLVLSFEAKQSAASAAVEKIREQTMSPPAAKRHRSSIPLVAGTGHSINAKEATGSSTASALLPLPGPETVQRSTTPPFSPPPHSPLRQLPVVPAVSVIQREEIGLEEEEEEDLLPSAQPSHPHMFVVAHSSRSGGELDIDDPDVPPISRATSVDTDWQDDRVINNDNDIEDGEIDDAEETEHQEHQTGPARSVLDVEDADNPADNDMGQKTFACPPEINVLNMPKSSTTGFKPKRPTMDNTDHKVSEP